MESQRSSVHAPKIFDLIAGLIGEADLSSLDKMESDVFDAEFGHAFAPFVFHLLSSQECTDKLGAKLREALEARSRSAAMFSLARDAILSKLGRELSKGGMDAILLKGAGIGICAFRAAQARARR